MFWLDGFAEPARARLRELVRIKTPGGAVQGKDSLKRKPAGDFLNAKVLSNRLVLVEDSLMQRGRKSSAELSVIPLAAQHDWLPPPADLTRSEQAFWNDLLASCPPGQFVQSDFPLLTSYVQATLLARSFAKMKTLAARDVRMLKAAMQMQAAMAQKLRLCPNSRLGPKLAGRKAAAHRPSFYDTMDLENAHNARDDQSL